MHFSAIRQSCPITVLFRLFITFDDKRVLQRVKVKKCVSQHLLSRRLFKFCFCILFRAFDDILFRTYLTIFSTYVYQILIEGKRFSQSSATITSFSRTDTIHVYSLRKENYTFHSIILHPQPISQIRPKNHKQYREELIDRCDTIAKRYY